MKPTRQTIRAAALTGAAILLAAPPAMAAVTLNSATLETALNTQLSSGPPMVVPPFTQAMALGKTTPIVGIDDAGTSATTLVMDHVSATGTLAADGLSGELKDTSIMSISGDESGQPSTQNAVTMTLDLDFTQNTTLNLGFDISDPDAVAGQNPFFFEAFSGGHQVGPELDFNPGTGVDTLRFGPGDYQLVFVLQPASPLHDTTDFARTSTATIDWSVLENGPPYGGAGAVPEPATWAMMISGFGLVGGMVRRSKRRASLSLA